MNAVGTAKKIITSQMMLVDYENEYLCTVNKDTQFVVIKHYNNGIFYGWNVYARLSMDPNLTHIETYNTEDDANSVVESIKKGLAFGGTYYRVPPNGGDDE